MIQIVSLCMFKVCSIIFKKPLRSFLTKFRTLSVILGVQLKTSLPSRLPSFATGKQLFSDYYLTIKRNASIRW